jgi:hypothetical protein
MVGWKSRDRYPLMIKELAAAMVWGALPKILPPNYSGGTYMTDALSAFPGLTFI